MIGIEPSINICSIEDSVNKCFVENSINIVKIELIAIKDDSFYISYVQPVIETTEVE